MTEPKKELFKAYHYLYKKSYDLNTDEGIKRYKIFKENLKYVEKKNAQELPFKLGINQFSDMSLEEYRETFADKKKIFKKKTDNDF